MSSLIDSSIEVIAQNQASSGAYIAAPGYGTYAYSWIRDGAFVAAAMDAYDRRDSAEAFHRWVTRTIENHAHKIQRLEHRAGDSRNDRLDTLDDTTALHTRYTVEGEEGNDNWGNFQLDGYGFWLSSITRHITTSSADPEQYHDAMNLVCRYLTLTWERPCFDCWEEYPTYRHSTTWAAIAKGLSDAGRLLNDNSAIATSDDIVKRLNDGLRPDGAMLKFVPGRTTHPSDNQPPQRTGQAIAGHERIGRLLSPAAIDGSALLVLGSFGPFSRTHPIVSDTLRAIESSLVVDGGVHRYLDDEYYGGGLWIVLAGALACVQASRDPQRARTTIRWIESQTDSAGNLGEQTSSDLRRPESLQPWIQRWGPPATPLLWSHAMYLLAADASPHVPPVST
ncbi:Glucoamylase [hydrothermal vent metagenome]|uniref:Glucoamylase n=1 Tax=hydrothermal vent metagenome TaxID=652676 RepID=A0A3B0RF03_9ZZZZ